MKGFIGFLIGAAIGGGAGYIIGRRIQIKKNDVDLAEMEKYYKTKYANAITKSDILREKAQQDHNAPKKTTEEPAEEAKKLQAEKFKTFDRVTPVKAPIEDYAAKYKGKITREEDDGPVLEDKGPHGLDSEEELAEMAQYKHMVIISPEEWEEDMTYEKSEVTWWENEEFFTDQYGLKIPFETLSPDDVGRANLNYFGVSGEEGVLYVRDEDNMEDYKIYLEESAYEGPTD